MKNGRVDKTQVIIGNEKKELDENGEVQGRGFKVNTKGQPLLSGIINKPVTVKQEFTGTQFSGNVDDIIAALRQGPK